MSARPDRISKRMRAGAMDRQRGPDRGRSPKLAADRHRLSGCDPRVR
ncbi:hypothetical protein LC55x_2769 [Lysobacter capsici]|nr:hypothetical protein LC55x_2769 [Lysobacter capsici]